MLSDLRAIIKFFIVAELSVAAIELMRHIGILGNPPPLVQSLSALTLAILSGIALVIVNFLQKRE